MATGVPMQLLQIFTFQIVEGCLAQGQKLDVRLRTDLELGRFEVHVNQVPAAGMQCHAHGQIAAEDWTSLERPRTCNSGAIQWRIFVDDGRFVQLHTSQSLSGDWRSVADSLSWYCHGRLHAQLEGVSLPEWVSNQLSKEDATVKVVWSPDVLQFVVDAEGRTLSDLVDDDAIDERLAKLVLRDATTTNAVVPHSVKYPSLMNLRADRHGAHGRGVVVLVGQPTEVVDVLRLTASWLLLGAARLRHVKARAETSLKALEAAGSAGSQSASDLTIQVGELRELRLELAVKIRMFLDGIAIPDLVVDEFRESFAESLLIEGSISSTQSALQSLSDVTEVTALEASRVVEEQRQASRRLWETTGIVGTVALIPVTLLLSFFGVGTNEVDNETSMFDFGLYWPIWSLTIILATAFAVGVVATRRRRS